jgi:uncharacterized protein (TIGR02145 family)
MKRGIPSKTKNMKKLLFIVALIATSFMSYAQVGIGTTTPAPSAILDLTSTDKALLITRVASTAAVTTPVNGMIVYDISSNCLKSFAGGIWSGCLNPPATNGSTNGTAVASAIDCNAGSTGTMTAGTAVSGVTQSLTVTATTAGTYNISASANGVTFAGAGTLSVGTQVIILTATGTPTTATGSPFTYTLNTTPGCSFTRAVVAATPPGGVTSYTCNTGSIGSMQVGVPVSGVTQTITANVSAIGSYTITATNNGVTFSASGIFTVTGSQNITLTATGSPISAAASPYTYTLGGTPTPTSNCSFTRTVAPATPAAVFCASGPTTVVDVTNPTTGRTWMDRNLGASQAATSSTDALSYGDLYQWGRRTDGHQCRTSPTTTTLSAVDQPGNGNFITSASPFDWRSPQNPNLWQGESGTNNPCPAGYRIPTEAELNAERLAFSPQNAAGAFASPLKLPMAGFRNLSNGSLNIVGSNGNYWSSTVSGTSARDLDFNSSGANMYADRRALGFSVRCLKD